MTDQDLASLAQLLDEKLSLFKKLTEQKAKEVEEQINNLEDDEETIIFKFERIIKNMKGYDLIQALSEINERLDKLHEEEWNSRHGEESESESESGESDIMTESDDSISIFSDGSANDILEFMDIEDEERLLIKKRDNDALQRLYQELLKSAKTNNVKVKQIEMFDNEEHLYREVIELAKMIVRDPDSDEEMEEEAKREDIAEKEFYKFMVDDAIRDLKYAIPNAPDFSQSSKKYKTYKKIVQLLEDHDTKIGVIREKANEMGRFNESEEFEKVSETFRKKLQSFFEREDVENFSSGSEPEQVKLPNKRQIIDEDYPVKVRKINDEEMETNAGSNSTPIVEESVKIEKEESNFHYPILGEIEDMYKEFLQEIKSKLDEDELSLIEISREQRSTALIINQKRFERLCKEIFQDYKVDLKFDPEVFEVLQAASEEYLVQLFEDTNLQAIGRYSQMIQPRDIQMVRRINGERH